MSMYAVNSNKCTEQYWDFEAENYDGMTNPGVYVTADKGEAEDIGHKWQGHIIELVEAPAKVVVSKAEAEILKQAKIADYPASWITESVYEDEDRLMRAYVNGWVVEKPKRFNVKVPKKWSGDDKHYWTKEKDGALTWAYLINNDYMIPAQQFTAAEIEH